MRGDVKNRRDWPPPSLEGSGAAELFNMEMESEAQKENMTPARTSPQPNQRTKPRFIEGTNAAVKSTGRDKVIRGHPGSRRRIERLKRIGEWEGASCDIEETGVVRSYFPLVLSDNDDFKTIFDRFKSVDEFPGDNVEDDDRPISEEESSATVTEEVLG